MNRSAIVEDIAGINERGERFFQEGDLARARACFERALHLDNGDAATRNNLAVVCWQEGDVGTALLHLSAAVAVEPDNRDFIINGLQMLLASGKNEEAEQLCTDYLCGHPDDVDLSNWLHAHHQRKLDEMLAPCASINQSIKVTPLAPQPSPAPLVQIGYEPSPELLDAVPQLRDHFNHYVRERKRLTHAGNDQRILLPEKYLRGRGLEVGGFHAPLPLPAGVNADYTDRYSTRDLKGFMPETGDRYCVHPVVLDDGEKLEKFADASYDFLIANHMLEHTQNVIGTILNHLRVIKPGGYIFYALPDKTQTFDRNRPLTTEEHIQRDYLEGPAWSHRDHLVEFHTLVNGMSGQALEDKVEEMLQSGKDIHFHTWVPETFNDQIRSFIAQGYIPATHIETVANGTEFICLLRKN